MAETVKVGLAAGIAAAILLWLIIVVVALPTTYLAMLFLGNLGVNVGFWGVLPGAIILSALKTRVTSK